MNIAKPVFSEFKDCTEGIPGVMKECQDKEADASDYKFQNEVVENLAVSRLEFRRCVFENVRFLSCEFYKADFTDVMFKDCDFSNSKFIEGTFNRAVFDNCKCMGADLSGTYMSNVILRNCRCKYMNLSGSSLKKMVFENVTMAGGAIHEVKMNSVEFHDCDLREMEVFHTPLADIDFCSSNISGWKVTPEDLKDALVTVYQAAEFAKLMGLKISY